MIVTVTLNAAVDKTYRVDGFALDRVHRPSEWRIAAGGKGINVARVYQTLGGGAVATGFLGGYNGRFIAASLTREGIEADFVRTAEESRVCIAVVDAVSRTQTEVNEVGPNVSEKEAHGLRRKFRALVRTGRFAYATLSGSLPPGVPCGIYADLLAIAREAGVHCVLDASGEALRAGLEARPWMAKPNVHELAAILGSAQLDREGVVKAARDIVAGGVGLVCVTAGRQTAVLVSREGAWEATPPAVPFVSAVGSGDSLLGAFVWATERGAPPPEAFRLGVGAGAANAAVYGAGSCTASEIERLAAEVRLCPLQ